MTRTQRWESGDQVLAYAVCATKGTVRAAIKDERTMYGAPPRPQELRNRAPSVHPIGKTRLEVQTNTLRRVTKRHRHNITKHVLHVFATDAMNEES